MKKVGEGLARLLKELKYAELKSLVVLEEMTNEEVDQDLAAYFLPSRNS